MTTQSLSMPQPSPILVLDPRGESDREKVSMSEISPASNPWDTGALPKQECLLTPEGAYKSMISFLNSWSGTPTVDLDIEERHTRFVQIVGGYPLINDRFPLDWPLHPGSGKALKLSLYLDSILVREDCSLRTYILEEDYKHRLENKRLTMEQKRLMAGDSMKGVDEGDKSPRSKLQGYLNKWRNLNRNCVAVTIAALRGNQNLDHTLSPMEESFLTSLHSTDTDRIQSCWPPAKNGPFKPLEIENPFFKKRPEGNPPPQDKPFRDMTSREKNNLKKWSIFNQIPNQKEVFFELNYIHTWMKSDVLKYWLDKEGEDSVGQRFVRGLSVICEAAMASIRQTAIQKYGVGSIVIDGGGRLSISVPEGDEEDAVEMLKKAYGRTFVADDNKPPSFLNRAVNSAFYGHVNGKTIKLQRKEGELGNLREETHGDCFVRANLPPFRCYVRDIHSTPPNPELLEIDLEPCKICNQTLKNDDWRGLKGSLQHDASFCFMHRLAFFVGTNQRQRDSILRWSKDHATGFPVGGEGVLSDNRSKLRKVQHICMIDANSLGYIFHHNRNQILDESNPGLTNDVRRRRSFRFNAQWYISLVNALDRTKFSGTDRIAAWVCAGDDLVLAQYGDSGDDSEATMYRFLRDFDKELQDNFSEIPLSVTFAGGTAQRIEGTGIKALYKDAMRRQEVAKLEWKNRMDKLGCDVDYLQKPTKSGEFESKSFNNLKERYWCTDEDNVFQAMDDSKPRSLVRMRSCDDIEIQCHHCLVSYPINHPKHSNECPEKEKPRPLRVRTSDDEPQDFASYDKYLEMKNS